MDGKPRSPIDGFKPQCGDTDQCAGAYRELLSIVRLC